MVGSVVGRGASKFWPKKMTKQIAQSVRWLWIACRAAKADCFSQPTDLHDSQDPQARNQRNSRVTIKSALLICLHPKQVDFNGI